MPAAAPVVTPKQRDALFAAVLVHDTVDLDAALPVTISLDFGPDQFARFFALARAVFVDGVDRKALARIATTALAKGRLEAREADAFRDVRARFKQLRFAFLVFGQAHLYPVALHRVTRVMGHLQDALRFDRRARVAMRALTLRLLAMPLPYAHMMRGLDCFVSSDRASFRAYVASEMAAIRAALARPEITAKHFHETRKIVSRLVAMFDCVDTLEPSSEHHAIVRYLSTINGLMGGQHDDMIARRLAGTQDYHGESFPLPEAVATRLRRLEQVFSAAIQEGRSVPSRHSGLEPGSRAADVGGSGS